MPAPTTPTLTLTRLSDRSFRATVGSDAGVTNRLIYRHLPTNTDTTGPTRVGPGTLDVTAGLVPNGQYLVYVISDNGQYSLPKIAFVSLTDTDHVTTAVKARWESSPAITALVPGGLYTSEVPETVGDDTVELPYAQLDVGKSFYEWTTESTYYEHVTVDLNIYAVGAEVCERILAEVRSIFDWKALPFKSATTVHVMPTDSSLDSTLIRYKDNSIVFKASVCYDIMVERKLAS